MKASRGDMRRAITMMQSASGLNGKRVTADTIHEVAGYVPDAVIDNLLDVISKGSFGDVHTAVENIEAEGFSALQVLLQLNQIITEGGGGRGRWHLNGLQLAALSLSVGEADTALTDGASEKLQLLTFCSKAIKIFKGNVKAPGSVY